MYAVTINGTTTPSADAAALALAAAIKAKKGVCDTMYDTLALAGVLYMRAKAANNVALVEGAAAAAAGGGGRGGAAPAAAAAAADAATRGGGGGGVGAGRRLAQAAGAPAWCATLVGSTGAPSPFPCINVPFR